MKITAAANSLQWFLLAETPGARLRDVCDNCGEAFIAEEIARKVHTVVNTEFKKGIDLEVVHYAA